MMPKGSADAGGIDLAGVAFRRTLRIRNWAAPAGFHAFEKYEAPRDPLARGLVSLDLRCRECREPLGNGINRSDALAAARAHLRIDPTHTVEWVGRGAIFATDLWAPDKGASA